ncbi:MAG: outer membrane beta-barrel protein [Muribaculaceae bacterium]|nr:outer membrane beta-barrel protein [Muribaculaceae bacterium]
MMKKLSIIFCLLLGSFCANAQIIEQGERNPIWGIRGAFDVNIPGHVRINTYNDKMFRAGTGGAISAVCNIYLGRQFYIEPAVTLFYDTYSYKDLVITNEDGLPIDKNPSIYKAGFRIPVVAGYSFSISDKLSIAPFTGPELSYAFAGDIKVHDKESLDLHGNLLFGEIGSQRRFECGWKIGVAFFSDMWSFNIDATIGMTNLMKNGTTFRENRGSVNVTRYF